MHGDRQPSGRMVGRSSAWQPTRRGGVRRTGLAHGQSTAQMKRRWVVRFPRPVRIGWHEKLGLPGCPYVIRWNVETPIGSVRLHHWLGPDDDRAYHDHPWWFVTLVLHGGYRDDSPEGVDELHAGSVRFRRALHRHTVIPHSGGAWTLMITGRKMRSWGFWRNGKFFKANKWFLRFGHHPCN